MIRCGYCGDIMDLTEEERKICEFYNWDEEKLHDLIEVDLDVCDWCRHSQEQEN